MSGHADFNVERFDVVMDAVLEGHAVPRQVEAFNACLRRSAAARLRYMAYIDMHAMLADPSGPLKDPAPDDLPDVMGELIDQALAMRRLREIEEEANRLLVAQQADEARTRRYDQRHLDRPGRSKRVVVIPQAFVWLTLAAVLGIVAIVVFQANKPIETTSPPQVQAPPATRGNPALADPVATLTRSFDAVWLRDTPADDGGMPAGNYTLTRGWAGVRTLKGVDIVLEGPVTFELGDNNAIILTRGQLVADVPRRARGFVVSTPGGRVVDLGTTFGVSVDPDGKTLAHVMSGEAEITAGRPGNTAGVRLSAGDAATVEPGGEVQRASAAPMQFVREVPATAYQAAVLSSGPMCYWRGPLDESTGVMSDYGWLEADGQGSGVRADPLGFSRDDPSGALDFGVESRGFITVPYHEAFEFSGAFTIELWCWIAPGHHQFMRAVSTRSESDGVGFGVNGTDAFSIETAGPNVPVLTFFGQRDIVGEQPLPEGRWTHLAATVDPQGRIRLYVNGVRCPLTTINVGSSVSNASRTPLMIGRNPFVSSGGGLQSWVGGLDEIAIYDRALTEDEVRKHYNAFSRQ
ncbi:MAG: LamG-like jellyroll fold domain-containing protein [Phycisphaerales bacterium JB063]